MAETALKFGPEWLRALSHGNTTPAAPVSPEAPIPKYKLAQYRYGREEMLALFSKDLKVPEELKQFDYLLAEKCQFPMALLPITEEEQRLWSRSVNSEVALRGPGKGPAGPGNGMIRGGRGGSVDRGRARGGRGGGFYPRTLPYDENDDGPPGGFTRLRTLERSQSVSEKDQRWDERDRRLDRFSGRPGLLEDGHAKQDSLRPPSDSWRRNDNKDDDTGGWRTANSRGVDKLGARNTWRVTGDRDRLRTDFEGKDKGPMGRDPVTNGPGKTNSHHPPRQRTSSGNFWDDDMPTGDNLPEWSMDEPTVTDVVGTFDSSGAFLETKVSEESFNSDEIYASDDEECVKKKESPEKKPEPKPVMEPDKVKTEEPSIKPPFQPKNTETVSKEETYDKSLKQSPKLLYIDKPKEPQMVMNHVPQTARPIKSVNPELCPPPKDIQNKTLVPEMPPRMEGILPGPAEEDAFAHHKKATENMMAQWTEEEEQNVASGTIDKTVLPLQHEDAQKWFYCDPQDEIQGPFTSAEMYEWFKAGYFQTNLKVRRGCDERFTHLGDLTNTWKRVPFLPGDCPPPLRVVSAQPVPNCTAVVPATAANPPPTTQPAASISQTDAQLRLMQHQLYQQLMQQQQMMLRQAQLQQLLVQLKQRESFTKMSVQQQLQAAQQLLAQQQLSQVPRPNMGSLPEQPVLEAVPPPAPFPMMGLPMPPLVKNDMSLWNMPPTSGTWPTGQSVPHPPGSSGSIWDADTSLQMSIDHAEVEKQKKLAAEEEEKKRQAAEAVKKLEEEKRQREEEEKKRKEEAERLLREIQMKQEEEKRRLEEIKRLKEEEEKRRQEELKRLEEIRKEEERRLEEIRRQEERQLEELRKQEEQRKLEEKKQAEREEQKRKELKRMEELRKIEEKKQEELQKKLKEQERQLEIERQKAIQKEKERQALELRLQKDAERHQEMQRRILAEKLQKEAERAEQELQQRREAELNQRPPDPKGPAWGVQQVAEQPSKELSLSDIQKLQEKKEKEEKERLRQQQLYQQQLFLQQQSLKQAQANKNGLSWAKRPTDSSGTVKSLAEIQQEEAQKLAQQQQKAQKAAPAAVQTPAVSGVWGNSSQLSRITAPPAWSASSNSGFWDDALKSTTPAQKPTKNSDSAFPALSNSAKPAVSNSNKNKNIRAKKDEDAVLKLFETHRKPTDEFTAWCTDTLSSLPSSVDVPTFVAFLKDVESPYEVFDYVRSYLGEGKEAKEFGKQFLERRSKFRNQAKQAAMEENMWGPAPAITPAAKPPSINDSDGSMCTKGKAKKKKNRMQKLDNSMLGFTVQPNPDRINVGEIDRVDGM